MKQAERERVERVVRKEVSAYFGPEGTDDDDVDALVLRLIHRELAKERAQVRRIIKAQESVSGGYIDKAKLLAVISRRKGRR